jgi:maltooligosyltrehalose trehalohydrolase
MGVSSPRGGTRTPCLRDRRKRPQRLPRRAQWLDDFHHALATVVTGKCDGYLSDFGTLADLAKAITEGFVYDGRYSKHRGRRHGNSSATLSGEHFVAFLQNHDQVANACHGSRLSALVPPATERIAAALLIFSPCLPLLFMGQEYGETAPFHYFTSHGDPALVEAVREGRRREFAAFAAGFSDPQAEETFAASKLDWSKRESDPHSDLLEFYRGLLALRRSRPALSNGRKDLTTVAFDETARTLRVERTDPSGDRVVLSVDFTAGSIEIV